MKPRAARTSMSMAVRSCRATSLALALLSVPVLTAGARGDLVGSYDFEGVADDTGGGTAENGVLLEGAAYIAFTRTGSGQAVDLTTDSGGDAQVRIPQAGTELDVGDGGSFAVTLDLYVPATAQRGLLLSQLGSAADEFGYEVRNNSEPQSVTGLDTFLLEYRVGKIGQALPMMRAELAYGQWYGVGITFDTDRRWNDTTGLVGQVAFDAIDLFPGWLYVDDERVDSIAEGFAVGGGAVGGGSGHANPIVLGGWVGGTFMGDAIVDALRIYDQASWPDTVPEPASALLLLAALAILPCRRGSAPAGASSRSQMAEAGPRR